MDLPELPNPVPPGFRPLSIQAADMDYIAQYWEMRDHADLIGWAVRLLVDLTKADEAGWRLSLAKAEIDETTKQTIFDPEHRQMVFLLKWLAPNREGFMRLPSVDTINQATLVAKST